MIWVPSGTDMTPRAKNGSVFSGPMLVGHYGRFLGLYRATRFYQQPRFRWFLTKRAMLRAFPAWPLKARP